FDEMSTDEWNRIMSVNLNGVFYVFRLAAQHMKARAANGDAFGRLIGTSSLAAVSGQARGEHYAATKGGLITMAKALAVEYARYGITAHTILPGWIETGMTETTFAWDKFVDNVMPRIPMRRWGQPEDFAGIAVYIMSQASSYHTSETYLIDGGYANF
ncbi:MAG: SDR family NAD(P)-dependent oxidoreductase, partial [Pseudomonadales bacterium]